MKYKAIIWDCDGVLIDSEVIACTVAVNMLRDQGYIISLEDYLIRFMGKNSKQMYAEIAKGCGVNYGMRISKDLEREKMKEAFAKDLKAMPGIQELLAASTLPMAVASGSSLERLNFTLGLTGLLSYFNGHIYSADMVENGKPAPDVFLLAAEKLGVKPEDCLVIEDGIHGLHGARAAGMDVIAFTGGSHMTPALRQALIDAKPQAVMKNLSEFLPFFEMAAKAKADFDVATAKAA